MPDSSLPDASWWEDASALRRFVADLLAAELALARPGRPPLAPPWPDALDLARDVGADSLELMGMSTALAEALHMEKGSADAPLLSAPRLAHWLAAAAASLRADGGRLTFRTSGSSGSPKPCTHALATLWQEIHTLADLLPGRRRILSAVPSHHIYGFLFTVLLPRRLGIGDVVDLRAAGPAALAGMLRPGDLVVAHPGWWEAVARLAPAFPADVVGVTSTAPCPDALADTLAAAGLRLLQVYGSSETAGVGWRTGGGAPFALLPYWSRTDDAAQLARALPDGSTARYSLQDKLAWDDAGRFLPAGRIDAAVQVGGTNVFPAYVADVLAMHPSVAQASVRLMRPDEGVRLKAFVVLREGLSTSPEALLDWCAQRLSVPERPAAVTFGGRLPRQASGKPADWIIDAQ
ncbi:AMP-binding enzyme [Massilia sp. TN1-12]|uniref:AMP-binding enzyme n=1 Tax=Massilia paldalensis TaxID=3377675 RepID=UPI0038510CB6